MAAERAVPVVGNGDILTHYEARDRMARSGVRSVMLARGALIKPWLFREIREGRSWLPTPEERFAVLWRFVELLREHFGDDERGRKRTLRFLPWHLNFFCRYRPFPEEEFSSAVAGAPAAADADPGDPAASPLEALLRDARAETHAAFAGLVVASEGREEALARALELQGSLSPAGDAGDLQVAAAEVAG